MFSAFIAKITAFFMTVIMFLFPTANIPKIDVDVSDDKTNYDYVFVHGLGGWGEYQLYYDAFPYWGTMGGDMLKYFNARGYRCSAASVTLNGSAWDRACELYAQLTGTRVDYGKEHSERCGHARYGKDYSRSPLIEDWSAENKINLLGHSFGGATVLLFLDLLADGSEAEKAATDPSELSGLFTGGKSDRVYSVTMLSAPMNGTTAYYIKSEIDSDLFATPEERFCSSAVGMLTQPIVGRDEKDCAGYDLSVDGAMDILSDIEVLDDVYYFSLPCAITTKDESGNWTFDRNKVEPFYVGAVNRIANWTGTTPNGYYCDESWQENDGLVNTISAKAPFGAPQRPFDRDSVVPGVYNVFDTYYGDHMSLMGDFFHNNNVRQIYFDILDLINNL